MKTKCVPHGPKQKAVEGFLGDRLALAFERERGYRRRPPWPLELDTVWAHVFRCECCGLLRREEDRREPRSEICIHCVRGAGFRN